MSGTAVKAPSGIVPIINTPFTDELEIDDRSLERLIARGIDEGISGCIVPAVASEVSKLSVAERKHMVEVVSRATEGKIPVVAGISSESLADSLHLAEHALSLGIDSVLCQVPQKLDGDDTAILAHFRELARAEMPLLVIQDLAWSGSGMRLELIRRLFDEIPAFRAIKIETVPAGSKYTAVLEATDGEIHVSCGWGIGQMLEAMERGVDAFTTTAINLPFVRIFNLFKQGRVEEARAIFDRATPYLIWCQQHIDISIHFLKHYCYAAGVFTTPNVREPIATFDSYHQRSSEYLIAEVLALEEDLRNQALDGGTS